MTDPDDEFDGQAAPVLVMWTVYENPTDYPGRFVARRFNIEAGQTEPIPTTTVIVGKTLEEVSGELRARGLYRIGRSPGDEPQIVETWL